MMGAPHPAPRAGCRWTPAEDELLAGRVTTWRTETIARHLGRSTRAVRRRIERRGWYPSRMDLVQSSIAAEITGLSPQHLTALARRGMVRAHRAPGRRWWLFDPASLPCRESVA